MAYCCCGESSLARTPLLTNISGAQRLPNGNRPVTPGPTGRLFEVTKEGAIVWEYIWPNFGANNQNSVYRAYRVPYSWIPQLPVPTARKVTPPALGDFHVAWITPGQRTVASR